VLLAHVVSTRCRGDVVTDPDMAYPEDWRTRGGRTAPDAGHQEGGRTVGLHSLAVLPRLQRCGIGQMIVRAFLDQMKNSGLVDRVALLCQDVSFLFLLRGGLLRVLTWVAAPRVLL
jgi:GNAT superfamily N-acetyltransferase